MAESISDLSVHRIRIFRVKPDPFVAHRVIVHGRIIGHTKPQVISRQQADGGQNLIGSNQAIMFGTGQCQLRIEQRGFSIQHINR